MLYLTIKLLNTVFDFRECFMFLGDIAEIKTGLVLSRKKAEIKTDVKATYKLLTLNNIGEDGSIINDSFEEFFCNELLEDHYFTKEGDVLLRLSRPFTAIYIDQSLLGLLVPSYFAVIKVNEEKILPQFLAWYLNTNNVKKELQRSQSGSRIASTNQQAIKRIPIRETPISKQKTWIKLYALHQKEKLLYKKLIEEMELYFQGITRQLLGGKENE